MATIHEETKNIATAMKNMLQAAGHGHAAYHRFYIPKKDGSKREINAPNDGLKELQRVRKDYIYRSTDKPYFAHGFEPHRSIYTNARIHCGKKHMLNIDIKDFFPSCTATMAEKVIPLDMEEWEFANEGVLPQGSPTSPAIANRMLASTDRHIVFMIKKFITDDVRYTRYADDITVSSNSRAIFCRATYQIIEKCLKKKGFDINQKKVRKTSSGNRMEVTGLITNSGKPTVPRRFRRNIRAAVHNASLNGCSKDERSMLAGKIGHIALCHPVEASRLKEKLKTAAWL